MISSRKPEKTTIPPPPSGPNPYENALDESGLSTTINEYGGPITPCGTGGGARPQDSSANRRTYSEARGRGFRGWSAGGGRGTSSGPHSSHLASSSPSFCRRGMTVSRRRRVLRTQRNRQSEGGTIWGVSPSWERMSPTAWYQPLPASWEDISSSSSGERRINLHLYNVSNQLCFNADVTWIGGEKRRSPAC